MDNNYIFHAGGGLLYNGTFVSEFEPTVVKVIHIIDKSNEKKQTNFVVSVKNINGNVLGEKEVDSLKNIPYFENWGCSDALLTGKEKKLLENKLQRDTVNALKEEVYLCTQGIYEDEKKLFMIFGDNVIGKFTSDVVIRINEPRKLKSRNMDLVLLGELSKKLILLIPGVTEMLFYGSMFAVLKPFLSCWGYKSDFMLALIGPSGHLKTTMVRNYALWLEDSSEQEITFSDYGRFDDVLKRIDNLVGQNFLADDLHMAGSRNGHERQCERLDVLCRHVSSVKQCAQIMITGEHLDNMGIFSCRDRMLQIKVPKMTSKELSDVKGRLNVTAFEYISGLAAKFAMVLIANQEKVKNDVEQFLIQNTASDDSRDYSLRISRHADYLKLTELLYRKYMLDFSEGNSCKEQLYQAIERNYVIQSHELQELRAEGENDIVIDLYKMISGNYLNIETDILRYSINGNDGLCCYFTNGKIYITKNILQTGMNRYLGRTCSARQLSDAMHDAGILEEDTDARTKKFRACRHYVINFYLLKQYCENKKEL